ncbi:MAG: flavin reductase [Treponema sp.]|nr:flavin reductase [Treponema sp.]
MYCIKKITDDLFWVGANDRRLAMFEGVYSVPYGVSYNSYLLIDEKTVLFDTVDKAVQKRFFENIDEVLGNRKLDYFVVQHFEPDHSAAFLELIKKFPELTVVCNAKTLAFSQQFFDIDIEKPGMSERFHIVDESVTLNTGKHNLHFVMAPMVHWPEVMVTYDSTDKILFSADAFGNFGALNGAIFADEVDFAKDYIDETRRYYSNIVGKYGVQVEALLNKASALEINMICPLHGFVWRKNLNQIISKYTLWSKYEPEEHGVMIAYASIYGNTENAAEILTCRLRDKGIKTVMFDVSVTPASEIISSAFKWSHLVFASATYNAGIFVTMEALINDLVSHNIQNRTIAIIENGSWAAESGSLIRKKLEKCKNIKILENTISIKSSLKAAQLPEIEKMAEAIAADFPQSALKGQTASLTEAKETAKIDPSALLKLSYGLFVLTARDTDINGKPKDNGFIINTVTQITSSPIRISIAINKANFTHNMIIKTKEFNVSVLSEDVPFHVFEHFGFQSGKDIDKFVNYNNCDRSSNNIFYISKYTNAVISAKVTEVLDYESYSLFIAEVTQAFTLSDEPSLTYQFYHNNIKPKVKPRQSPAQSSKKRFICKICGYEYEGDSLPDGFICPLCKHGVDDFEQI